PGNIREMENILGNACMMVDGNLIDVRDLPETMLRTSSIPAPESNGLISFEELQQRHLMYVLNEVEGNKARAAEILGISRSSIYSMLEKTNQPSIQPAENKPTQRG